MGTNGILGCRTNNIDTIYFFYVDAGSKGLGKDLLTELASNKQKILQNVKTIQTLDDQPENEQRKIINLGNYIYPELNKPNTYLYDGLQEFLSCKFFRGYLLNEDTDSLEIYMGGTNNLTYNPQGRYIKRTQNEPTYTGPNLIHEIPLSLITPNSIDYHINTIDTAAQLENIVTASIEQQQKIDKLISTLNNPIIKIKNYKIIKEK